ncbi:dicarboxylate/amino acid:cation symporter [Capnocytophaga canimorsus]|uniref:Sodium:proton antiporter n=1 Tax=Capnocytophaga canimorsus TaxID=28188 RepID=A0AAD0EB97_9FLAO|nr:dicarboxylate/amino acid:cation symporter [Capnocytophaga canimorsus]ATA94898.1 sodium:proton antiporter [Capnocytophaga canimorsus]
MLQKIFSNLLFKVIIAILLGILFGQFFPEWFNRIFATFNELFSQFLSFSIPLIIMGLIMPAIADLGKNAGKLLLITIGITYTSTFFSGFATYWVSDAIFPDLIQHTEGITENNTTYPELLPFFTVPIPPVIDVMAALVLAFMIGLGLSFKKEAILVQVVKDFQEIIIKVIERVIVPLLPIFILGIFSQMTFNGKVYTILSVFLKIVGIIFLMHIVLLLIQYLVAAAIAKRNPFKALLTMMPAYFTALGTQSSAATIPVTLKQVQANGVSPDIAGFVVPLCATIHLAGSIMKIVACAIALMIIQQIPYDFELIVGFILMLGIVMVAAPGVPGGAIMAAVGVLQTILGFDQQQVALMITLYIAMDSFGTACNVTGDGAIALIIDKIYKKRTTHN